MEFGSGINQDWARASLRDRVIDLVLDLDDDGVEVFLGTIESRSSYRVTGHAVVVVLKLAERVPSLREFVENVLTLTVADRTAV